MAGQPLVYWTVKAACDCSSIDKVYVATDSHVIKETVEGFKLDKVCVIGRSEASASDTASTESAMLEFAGQYEFENIVLMYSVICHKVTDFRLVRAYPQYTAETCQNLPGH